MPLRKGQTVPITAPSALKSMKKYRLKNADKIKEYMKEYNSNPEKKAKQNERLKEYYHQKHAFEIEARRLRKISL